MDDLQRMLNDIRFYDQILGDAKRTICCPPEHATAVRDEVERRGAGHLFTVLVSPVCPPGKLIVIDEQAMEASMRQAALGPIKMR